MRSRNRARNMTRATNPTLFGISGWDASTALATASGEGIAGDATNGVSVVVMWTVAQVPSGVQRLAQRTSGNSGWTLRSNGNSLQFIVGNGTTLATAPVHTLVAGNVGKIHVSCGTCDGAAVYEYLDNAQVGTSTALAGYAAAAINTAVGSSSAGANPATDYTILGVMGRDSHLSLAHYQTICAATKANGVLSTGGISMDHLWRAPVAATMPSTVSDLLGAHALTFVVGAAANLVLGTVPPVWGW